MTKALSTMTIDPAKIPVIIHPDHRTLAVHVAERIAAIVREKPNAVLGLPTGSTPKGIYRELVRLHAEGHLDLSHVRTFNLDEYYPINPEALQSYRRFMHLHLFRHVTIRPENIHIPRGDISRDDVAGFCERYEEAIAAAGGLDFQMLGIGRSGHIGFNEPGTPEDARTRLVLIHPFTRRDAAADFFGEENVPREAITMGTATILSAREIVLVALGENKSSVIARAVEGPRTIELPASLLQEHPNASFHLDYDSAADLTRIKTPWLVSQYYEFEDSAKGNKEKLRAVIWLSESLKKPIREVSEEEYIANGLASLVLDADVDKINNWSTRILAAKVRDCEELPSREKIILFSPHPDDDVISAGGMFRKLVENANDVFVAYQTSGNIAVFDHDVLRYLDFVSKYLRAMKMDESSNDVLKQKMENFLANKEPGEIDIPEVAAIKQFIREAEAVSGAMHVGLKRSHCIFMNLPFYQTGAIEKAPPGEADIEQTLALLNRLKPTRILAAGDLSDPHGTHRVCLWITREAVKRMPKEARPKVWLYRGAWQEWPLDEADILAPLSETELALKLEAIFKHQSQKDRAMFPGPDEREFWQRVNDRNTATAGRFYKLGLPFYHAMEAYVEQIW
jgi:glucosamine-6-phosphate deaminase